MKLLFTFLFGLLCYFNVSAQNHGLNFDGVDDYVQVPDNSALPSGSAITVETWFNPGSGTWTYPYLFDHGDYFLENQGSNFGAGNTIYLYLSTATVFNASVAYVLPSSLTDTWHHIAFTYDGAFLILYLDGINVGQTPLTGTLTNSSRHDLILGNFFNGTVDAFKGTLDEFRIWDVARTQAQIQSTMSTEIAGNTPGLVAYYRFNQGTLNGDNTAITAVSDAAVTPHNGTLNNFALTGSTSNFVAGYPSLIALPLNLLSFTGEPEGKAIYLNWKTAGTKDIVSYNIEKSPDGRNFSKIGSVTAQANGLSEQTYSYRDDQPGPNYAYYRLKSIEISGEFSYSTILLIKRNAIAQLAVFPNPVTQVLQLQTTQKGKFTVLIQDVSQRVVKRLELTSNTGYLTTAIDVSTLAKGIYIIHIGKDVIRFLKQ